VRRRGGGGGGGGREGGGTCQSEVRYSLALVRVRVSRPGAARVLVAPVVRRTARVSLVMVRPIVDCGGEF